VSSAVTSDSVAAILGRGSPRCRDFEKLLFSTLPLSALSPCRVRVHEPEALLARGVRCLMEAQLTQRKRGRIFASGWRSRSAVRAFLSHESCAREGGVRAHTTGFKRLLNRAASGCGPAIKAAGLETFFLSSGGRFTFVGVSGQNTVRPRDLQGATVGLWAGRNARAFAERLVRARPHVLVYSSMQRKMTSAAAGAGPPSPPRGVSCRYGRCIVWTH